MRRAMLIVLDSLGVGELPDAARYGDVGADTLGHIAAWCARPADDGGRGKPLSIPNLVRLGLADDQLRELTVFRYVALSLRCGKSFCRAFVDVIVDRPHHPMM